VLYVEELIGRDTINTMPLQTLDAFRDHGRVRETLTKDLPGQRAVVERLAAAGIDLEAVAQQLEDEGVQLFVSSFDKLAAAISERAQEIGALGTKHVAAVSKRDRGSLSPMRDCTAGSSLSIQGQGVRSMTQIIPGIFRNREQAAAAIDALHQMGLTDQDIGVLVPEPGHYMLLDEDARQESTGLATGVATGALVGSLAGIGLMAVALPIGGARLSGVLVGGALLSGAAWGSMLGGYAGLLARVFWNEDADRWCDILVGSTDVLVMARVDAHRADQVLEVMHECGALYILDPARLNEADPKAEV